MISLVDKYLTESIKSFKDKSDFYKKCRILDNKYYWTPWYIVDYIKSNHHINIKDIADELFNIHVSEFLESDDYDDVLNLIQSWNDKDKDKVLDILKELKKNQKNRYERFERHIC